MSSYFNTKTNNWEIEAGAYEIEIGASSVDIKLEGAIEQKGTTDVLPYDIVDLPTYASAKVQQVPDAEFEHLLGRPIPQSEIDRKAPLGYNSTLSQLKYAKGGLGRFAYHALNLIIKMFKETNKPLANTITMGVLNLPFRGLARMAGGAITMSMVDGILKLVNGEFGGLIHVVTHIGDKGSTK